MAIDIDKSHYNTGTAEVVGTAVTGTGTAWLGAVRKGDQYGTHLGFGVRIDEVIDNTHLTLAYAVAELDQADGPYEIQRTPYDIGYLQAIEDIIRLMGEGALPSLADVDGTGGDKLIKLTGPNIAEAFEALRLINIAATTGGGVIELAPNGDATLVPKTDLVSGVAYDVQVDTLADRAAYNGQTEGFSVLVANVGDGRAAVYAKASAASGDWTDPAYVTGPIGLAPVFTVDDTTTLGPGSAATFSLTPTVDGYEIDIGIPAGRGPTPLGDYDPGTAYVLDDAVLYNGSTFIALGATTGNAPPTLPTTSNAHWQLLARQGIDGAGTVSSIVPGPGISVDNADPTAPVVSSLIAPPPQGRLTLTSGVAITTSDVVGATTIYYVPTGGNTVPLWSGAAFGSRSFGTGLSLALDANSGHAGYHEAGTLHDIYAFDDGGTLRLGSRSWVAGAVPGTISARGTGAGSTELEFLGGLAVNKYQIDLRFGSASGNVATVAAREATYLGSVLFSVNGQADDTEKTRFLYNAYNQTERRLRYYDPGADYNYSLAAFRAARGSLENYVAVVLGLPGFAHIRHSAAAINSTSSLVVVTVSIGLNSRTVPATTYYMRSDCTNDRWADPVCFFDDNVPLGFNYFAMLEFGAGLDTQTWTQNYSNGMTGTVMM